MLVHGVVMLGLEFRHIFYKFMEVSTMGDLSVVLDDIGMLNISIPALNNPSHPRLSGHLRQNVSFFIQENKCFSNEDALS